MICNKSSNDNSLGMKLLGSSKTAPRSPLRTPHSSVCATSPVFTDTIVMKLLVFKATADLGEGDGSGQVKMSQALLFWGFLCFFLFFEIPLFSLNKHPLGCYKLLVNFESSGKVDLTVLPKFLLLLWMSIFSNILTLLSPPCIFWMSLCLCFCSPLMIEMFLSSMYAVFRC